MTEFSMGDQKLRFVVGFWGSGPCGPSEQSSWWKPSIAIMQTVDGAP